MLSLRDFCLTEIRIPLESVDAPLQRNAKVPFIFQFHEVFLRVGVTKYCKLQGNLLTGSVAVSKKKSRALYQHL